jgi:hypothetical protein
VFSSTETDEEDGKPKEQTEHGSPLKQDKIELDTGKLVDAEIALNSRYRDTKIALVPGMLMSGIQDIRGWPQVKKMQHIGLAPNRK